MSINWQDVLTNLAVVTGGGTVLVGACAWLIKTAITHKLKADEDAFKIRMQKEADIEIKRLDNSLQIENERLKSSLQIIATERQIRFTKLHEKRAEIIAELYKRLLDLHRSCESYVEDRKYTLDPGNKALSELLEKKSEFIRFYEQHEIYLPLHVVNSLESLPVKVTGKAMLARLSQDENRFDEDPSILFEMADKDFLAVRKALEDEFRKMLGVENGSVRDSVPSST